MKVRQKHLVSFSELVTEYEKAKRHSVEKTAKIFFRIFGAFRRKFSREWKWEQVDSWRANNKCDREKVAR